MYLRLEFKNDTIFTSDIYLQTAKETKVLYNNLKYAENSFKLTVPWNEALADRLKMDADADVKAWIKIDDNTNYFSGYLRKTFGFSKAYRNKPISLEVVTPGFFFDKEASEPFHLAEVSLKQIVTELLLRTDYNGRISVDNLEEITVPFFMLNENENIKNVLDQILFEYGFAYDFDTDGNFYTFALYPSAPSVITQVFNGQNCFKSIDQTVKENVYKKIVVNWDKIEHKEDVLIFEDTSGATAELAANIELLPSAYFKDEETVYLKYDSSFSAIKWIDYAYLVTKYSASGVRQLFVNNGMQGELSLYNSASRPVYINELKVQGDGWFQTTDGNQTITGENDANKREIRAVYIMEEERASELARNILNYYRYANFTITLKSSELYEPGTFCKVSDNGIGTVTAKIISRVWNLKSNAYEYTLESVSEYDPAEMPVTKTVVPAVAPSASLLQSVLQGVYASHTVELFKRSVTAQKTTGITSRLYYDFSKNTVEWESESGANGWTTDRESLTGDGTLYVIAATAFGKTQIDTIEVEEWSTPIPYGLNGRDGINSFSLQLFIRSDVKPNRPASDLVYNFETSAITGNLNGWSKSIPGIDDEGNGVWEIHATVTSTTDTGVIAVGQFSEPVLISKEIEVTRADVEQIIKDINMVPTAVVYSDLTFAGIQTNSDGIVTADQSFTANFRIIQGETSLDFTFGRVELPNDYDWSYTTYEKSITIRVRKGARLLGGNIIVNVSYRELVRNYGYGNGTDAYGFDNQIYGRKEYSETVTNYPVSIGYAFIKGGIKKGPYDRVSQIPFSELVIGDYFTWTGENTVSDHAEGGMFKAGAVYYWDGFFCQIDTDSTHAASAMSEVLSVAGRIIAENNPMIDTLLRRISGHEIFTDNLFVTGNAWINAIASKNVKVGDENGNGSIEASRYEKGLRGWKLDEEHAEFNDVTVRGTVEARRFSLLESARSDFEQTLGSFAVATTDGVEKQIQKDLENYPSKEYLEKQLEGYASDQDLIALGNNMISDTQIVRYRTEVVMAPLKPSEKVTETGTNVNNRWTKGNLSYSNVYKYYYWCYQYVKVDGSVYFSDVYLDQTKIDANTEYYETEKDREAFAALSRVVDTKASSQSVTDLGTQIQKDLENYPSKADLERQLEGYASEDDLTVLDNSMLTDAQIVRYRSNTSTAPAKPSKEVTETGTGVNKKWTKGNLTYSDVYKYYFWCYQYVRKDGSVYFSDVYLDQTKIDANTEHYESEKDREAFNNLVEVVDGKADNEAVENLEKDIDSVREEIPTDTEIKELSTVSVVAEISNWLFLVSEDGTTPVQQTISVPLHAYLGRDTEINVYIRDDLFSSSIFELKHQGNTAVIAVKEGVFVTSGSIKIPLNVEARTAFMDGYGYKNKAGDGYANANTSFSDKLYFVTLSYTARQGGVYRGSYDTLSFIPTDMLIDDYIAWLGTDVTAEINGYPVELIQGRVYRWNGRYYQEDKKTSHFSQASYDILSLNDDILSRNNSDVTEYFKRIVSKQTFTDQLIANEAFVRKLVADQGFVEELGSKNLLIKEGGSLASENFSASEENPQGFYFGTYGQLNGVAILNKAIVRGEIYATGLVISPGAKVSGLGISSVGGLDTALEGKASTQSVNDAKNAAIDNVLTQLVGSGNVRDHTIIEGGKITTGLIDVDEIKASKGFFENIEVTGEISAKNGYKIDGCIYGDDLVYWLEYVTDVKMKLKKDKSYKDDFLFLFKYHDAVYKFNGLTFLYTTLNRWEDPVIDSYKELQFTHKFIYYGCIMERPYIYRLEIFFHSESESSASGFFSFYLYKRISEVKGDLWELEFKGAPLQGDYAEWVDFISVIN